MLGILAPIAIAEIGVTSNSASRLNMLTPSPREVWVSASGTSALIDIDFGSAVQFDRVYMWALSMVEWR